QPRADVAAEARAVRRAVARARAQHRRAHVRDHRADTRRGRDGDDGRAECVRRARIIGPLLRARAGPRHAVGDRSRAAEQSAGQARLSRRLTPRDDGGARARTLLGESYYHPAHRFRGDFMLDRTDNVDNQSLRGFLQMVETRYPEDIVRIRDTVDPKFDMTALVFELEQAGRNPVVVLENVAGYDMPIVTN